jgi:hypothetical protein
MLHQPAKAVFVHVKIVKRRLVQRKAQPPIAISVYFYIFCHGKILLLNLKTKEADDTLKKNVTLDRLNLQIT